jgi:Transposase IS200 like.
MQVTKSITARQIFKQYSEIKKQLWGGELWNDGGYIGTV